MRVFVTLMIYFFILNSFIDTIIPNDKPNIDEIKVEDKDTIKDIVMTSKISLYKWKKLIIKSNIAHLLLFNCYFAFGINNG